MPNLPHRRPEYRSIPNYLAYAALFGWPLVCIAFFAKLPVEKAAVISLVAGYLILPASLSIDIPMVPPLDKFSVTGAVTFLLCWMKGTQATRPNRSIFVYAFAALFVISPILTSYDNSYELHIADRSLPGFYPLDALKMSAQNLITLAPFFVGMRFVSTDTGRAYLLRAIIVGALLYSLLMLVELRLSPQLQRLIYGVAPGNFIQLARAGGYRPLVFLSTGLEVALFTALAFMVAIASYRLRWRVLTLPGGATATYLGGMLLLCKTLGAILYGSTGLLLLMFSKPKTWVRISCVIALILCAYPLLRTYDIIPVRRVLTMTNSVSVDRGDSFGFRILNEDILLNKANEKPYFGWGTWSRNRVYDDTGADLTITDGTWILRYGIFGWCGYLGFFGLFAAAVFRAGRSVRGPVTEESIVIGTLTLLLTVNLIDLVPNANVTSLTYLLAGSIAARARARVMFDTTHTTATSAGTRAALVPA